MPLPLRASQVGKQLEPLRSLLRKPRRRCRVFLKELEPNLSDDVELKLVVPVWRRVHRKIIESVLVKPELGFQPRSDRLALCPFP